MVQVCDSHYIVEMCIFRRGKGLDVGTGTSPGNQFNDTSTSDLKLTLNNREGYSVTVNVHRHILVSHSRFFAAKLSDRWSKQQQCTGTNSNLIEITDIDDMEIYLETLRLMYCEDVKRSLMKENVSRILGILKVCMPSKLTNFNACNVGSGSA